MSDEANLLECPFCKRKGDRITVKNRKVGFFMKYWVTCDYCGAFQSKAFGSEEKAIKAWNKFFEIQKKYEHHDK